MPLSTAFLARMRPFQQECPCCGRPLWILAEHRGQQVTCSHCRRRFVARDPSGGFHPGPEASPPMLDRAEQLLRLLESPCRRLRLQSS